MLIAELNRIRGFLKEIDESHADVPERFDAILENAIKAVEALKVASVTLWALEMDSDPEINLDTSATPDPLRDRALAPVQGGPPLAGRPGERRKTQP